MITDDKIKEVYDALKNDGYTDLPDEKTFHTAMGNKEKRKELYDALERTGFSDLPDYNTFDKAMTPNQSSQEQVAGTETAPSPDEQGNHIGKELSGEMQKNGVINGEPMNRLAEATPGAQASNNSPKPGIEFGPLFPGSYENYKKSRVSFGSVIDPQGNKRNVLPYDYINDPQGNAWKGYKVGLVSEHPGETAYRPSEEVKSASFEGETGIKSSDELIERYKKSPMTLYRFWQDNNLYSPKVSDYLLQHLFKPEMEKLKGEARQQMMAAAEKAAQQKDDYLKRKYGDGSLMYWLNSLFGNTGEIAPKAWMEYMQAVDSYDNIASAADNAVSMANAENDGTLLAYLRGTGQRLADLKTYDFTGMIDAGRQMALGKALDDVQKNGEKASPYSQNMIKAAWLASEMEGMAHKHKAAFTTAQGVIDTAGYMAQFYLGGKVGGEAIAKGIVNAMTKDIGKEGAKVMARKAAAHLLGRGAQSLYYTALFPGSTIAEYNREINGDTTGYVDEKGDFVYTGQENQESKGKAAYNAVMQSFNANMSEMLGEYFPLFGKYLAKTKAGSLVSEGVYRLKGSALKAIAANKKLRDPYIFLSMLSSNKVAKAIRQFRKDAKFSGTFGEYAEEVANNAMDALTNDGGATWKDVTDPGQNAQTFLQVAIVSGAMGLAGAVGGIGRQRYKSKLEDGLRMADYDLTSTFGEDWAGIREKIDGGTEKERKEAIDAITKGNYSAADKHLMLEYAKNRLEYNGAKFAEMNDELDGESNLNGEDKVQQDVDNAYDEGRDATDDQKNDIKLRYEYATRQMRQLLGTGDDTDLNGAFGQQIPTEVIRSMRSDGRSEEDIQKAMDYFNAKSAYDGMIQGVRDRIDEAVRVSDETVESRRNKADGMIHPATLKAKDSTGNDRKAYIISGNVAMLDDGTMVDKSASDGFIVIQDAETGRLEHAAPEDFLSVDIPIDAEQEKQASAENIRQQYAQREGDTIDGVLQFTPGDQYSIVDGQGQQHTIQVVGDAVDEQGQPIVGAVTVLYDGQQQPVVLPKQQVQQMSDAENMARFNTELRQREAARQQAGKQPSLPFALNDEFTLQTPDGRVIRGKVNDVNNDENKIEVETEEPLNGNTVNYFSPEELQGMVTEYNGAPVERPQKENLQAGEKNEAVTDVNDVATAVGADEAPATEPMPMVKDKNGEDTDEPDWQAVTPQRGHAYIYSESGLPREVANQLVNNNLADAQKKLETLKKKQPKIGTSIAKYNSDLQKWQEQQQTVKATADYWTAVKDEQNKVLAAEQKRQAEINAAKHDEAVGQERLRKEAELKAAAERAAVGNENPMPQITERWNNAPKVDGVKDEIVLPNGEKVTGHYVLTESGAASPSHNALNGFQKTAGFPMDENGGTVNDRDYERDAYAQRVTRAIAGNYDSRALQTPVVVSQDGVVLSGNGRTMAGELAAYDNTDTAYNNYVRQYAQKYGFTQKQVGQMQHPRVVFVPDERMPYSADTFAKFNQQEMKSQSKTEQAVKMGKIVNDSTFGRIVRSINKFDTLGDFYNDPKATNEAVKELQSAGVITPQQVAEIYDGEGISAIGREILENTLIGKAFENNPDAVRMITEFKSMRQSIITALSEIANNLTLGKKYSLENELSEAVKLCYEARKDGKYKVGDKVSGYASQGLLFGEEGETVADYRNATIMMLADILNDPRVSQLKKTLAIYNNGAADSAKGLADIFTGKVRGKEEIIKDVLNLLNNGTAKEQQAAVEAGVERRKTDGVRENGSTGTNDKRKREDRLQEKSNAGVQENAVISDSEIEDLISRMEDNAMPTPHIELNPTNWFEQFGQDGKVPTPLGLVKMGENQIAKLFEKGRSEQFGMIKPTLVNPLVIIEEPSEANDGNTERDSSLLFVKTFIDKNGTKVYYFKSVTVKKDGLEVSVSSHYDRPNRIKKALKKGKLLYRFDGGAQTEHRPADVSVTASPDETQGENKFSSSDMRLTEPLHEGQDLIPTPNFKSLKDQALLGKKRANETSTTGVAPANVTSEPVSRSDEPVGSTSNQDKDLSENKGSEVPANDQEKAENSIANKGLTNTSEEKTNISETVKQAEQQIDTNPTDAQKEAGNYKKGHLKLDGYDITIEQPKGSIRRGKDTDGKEWESEMHNTYGYIRGTEGVDGDHIDVFLSDNPTDGNVYVIDQVNPKTGEFDEHKIMYGFPSEETAREAYLYNYEKGWKGLGSITEVSKEGFKKWIDSSKRKTKPFAEYKSVQSKSLLDENGYPFIKTSNGSTDFGEIKEETGLTPAPIRLSEGFQNAEGKGYGLKHIESRHGEQIRKAGFKSVIDFVENVAQNFTTIRKGNNRSDNKTFLLEVKDKHNNTLFIELSKDGSYWNVNSGGIFHERYSQKKEVVWTLPTVGSSTSADATGVNHGNYKDATVTSGNSPQTTSSENKDSKKVSDSQTHGDLFAEAEKVAQAYRQKLLEEAEAAYRNETDPTFKKTALERLKTAFMDVQKSMHKGLKERNKAWEEYFNELENSAPINKVDINGLFGALYDKGETKLSDHAKPVSMNVEGENEEPLPVGKGPFGNIYTQFKGKVKEAITFLTKKKSGEAIAVLHHPEVGDISLVWGDAKAGLEKILQKHPEVVNNLQGIMDDMHIVQSSDNRIVLDSPTHRAVVSKMLGNKRTNQWLLTAYEKKKKSISAGSSDIDTEPEGKQNGTAPLQNTTSTGKGSKKTSDSQTHGELLTEAEQIAKETAKKEEAAKTAKEQFTTEVIARELAKDKDIQKYFNTDNTNITLNNIVRDAVDDYIVNTIDKYYNDKPLLDEILKASDSFKAERKKNSGIIDDIRKEIAEIFSKEKSQEEMYGGVTASEKDEAMRKLRDMLLGRGDNITAGLDMKTLLEQGGIVTRYFVCKGAVKFADFAKTLYKEMNAMSHEAAENLKPYIKRLYMQLQGDETMDEAILDKMDDAKTVRAYDLTTLGKPEGKSGDVFEKAEQIANEAKVDQAAKKTEIRHTPIDEYQQLINSIKVDKGTLPKGVKWTDGIEKKTKGGKRMPAETVGAVFVGNDLYTRKKYGGHDQTIVIKNAVSLTANDVVAKIDYDAGGVVSPLLTDAIYEVYKKAGLPINGNGSILRSLRPSKVGIIKDKKIRRQAEREDGQLLILPSNNVEEVGALSDPTSSLTSVGKDSKKVPDEQTKENKNDVSSQPDLFENVGQKTNNYDNGHQESGRGSQTVDKGQPDSGHLGVDATGPDGGLRPGGTERTGGNRQAGAGTPADGVGLQGREGVPGEAGDVRVGDKRRAEGTTDRRVHQQQDAGRVRPPQRQQRFTNNYRYPEDAAGIDDYTPAQRLSANVKALDILRNLLREGRQATPGEREVLGRFRGWGGINLGRAYSTYTMRDSGSKELKQLADIIDELDPDGKRGILKAVNRAVLTSYYTPTEIARTINGFLKLAGYRHGNLLDPSMGSGVFEGTMPADLQQRTEINGVELDWLTGQIARQLYPDANIRINGFEASNIAPNSFDVVESNVPFGSFGVTDSSWKNDNDPVKRAAQGLIHNYYAVKILEATRPGGLCVMLTTHAVMDSPSNKIIRDYIADKSEILGAMRLPDNTFKGAGTSVVTDVIFLRKYKDEEDRNNIRSNPDYIEQVESPFLTSSEISVSGKDGKAHKVKRNGYYTANPKHLIGEETAGGQYSADQYGMTSGLSTSEIAGHMGDIIRKDIVGKRKGNLYDTTTSPRQVFNAVRENYTGNGDYVSNGNIVVQDGKYGLLTAERGKYGEITRTFEEQRFTKDEKGRIDAMMPLRTAMKELISEEINRADAKRLSSLRDGLKKQYDSYVKRYGRLQEKSNDYIKKDIDGFTLRSLEKWDDGKFTGLSDIFFKSTIKPTLDINKVKTPQDAIGVSLSEYGEIRNGFMEKVLGKDWEEQCGNAVFRVPFSDNTFVTRDSYLSGDVKTKLEQARQAAEKDKGMERNVEALEEVQPKTIPFTDINIRMGARWIPSEVYTEFMQDVFGIPGYGPKSGVVYSPEADSFIVNVNKDELGGVASAWNTKRKSAKEIFEAALSDKSLKVYDTYKEDGVEKKVLNREQTDLANNKVQDLRTAFEDWLPADPKRVQMLQDKYNDLFNRSVLRKFDGSHLNVAGLVGKELRPHQKDAVWMLVNNRGGIVDHIVGAGKTLVMESAVMEMRRMGIAKKPMIVALKSTVAQMANEFRKDFPAARILAPTERDFRKENRKKLLANISLNDYDCVILSHEQYCMLPHSEEVETQTINEQLAQLDSAIEFLYGQGDKSQLTKRQIKGLEKRKANLEAKLQKLTDRKVDREFTFENLGVDYLFVDECQQFKSLPYVTSYQNVAGLGDPTGSQKAVALLNGVRYLQNLHQGDYGTVFLSGTTITNSLVEIYNLLNYLRPREMQRLGLTTFDAWASQFAVKSPELEYGVTNELKEKVRFRSFTNVPELAKMYAEIADVRNDLNLKLPKPKPATHIVTVPASDELKEINKEVINMVNSKDGSYFGLQTNEKSPFGLLASNISAKAAISTKLVNPTLDDDEGKVKYVSENVKEIYDKFAGQKGTQLIFCDLGVPVKGKPYDAYNDIINRLVNEYGIPRKEIADIHEANSDAKRKELFANVNDGKVRILIGGTKNMGTGVNVQKRIVAMHHVDVPWTPADREQREGRGVRQGNEVAKESNGNKVDIYFYATEGSLDMYKYQLQDSKGKMFTQFKTGTVGERDFDEGNADEDSGFDPAEVVALLSGNPVIFEKSKMDKKVEKLRRAKRAYESDYQRRKNDYGQLLESKSNYLRLQEKNKMDIAVLQSNGFKQDDKGVYPTDVSINVPGKYWGEYVSKQAFDKPKEAGAYIHKLLKEGKSVELSGFGMKAKIGTPDTTDDKSLFGKRIVELEAPSGIKYTAALSDDDTAAGTVFRTLLTKVLNNQKVYSSKVENVSRQLEGADPGEYAFPKQAELDKALEEKHRLDVEYKKLSDEEDGNNAEDGQDSKRYRFGDESDTFVARQKAAVENRGTVMPGLNEASVKVTDVPRHTYKGTAVEAKRQAIADAKEKYVGEEGIPKFQHYENFGQAFDYTISGGSIDESMNHKSIGKSSNMGAHIAVLNHLPEVIENSIKVEEHPDYKKNTEGERDGKKINKDVLIHRFYGAVNIDGELFRVKTTIKENNDSNFGNTQYTYEVTNVELLADESTSSSNGVGSATSTLKTVCPLAKLLQGVEKSYDKGKYLLDESKNLTNNDRYRTVDKEITDDEVSYENDPMSKMLGGSYRTTRQRREFSARNRQRMQERASTITGKLGISNDVEIVTDTSGLKGEERKAKGWYDRKTGKITIIVPNHTSVADIEQTVLHEAVAHYGLRKLFGENFDNFLDNVFKNADEEIRRKIVDMASGKDWDFRTATEEYLAGLAENTEFENVNASWWRKIKQYFLQMLRKLGLAGTDTEVAFTDNELRYILWRSYENLKEPGRYRNVFAEAKDIAMQDKLKVGNYAVKNDVQESYVAEPLNDNGIVEINERFNDELERQVHGTLPEGHIYQLGMPGSILRSTGFPYLPIQLNSTRLADKATHFGHDYDLSEIKNLVEALQNPLAVFSYGNKGKAQNVIVELTSGTKNFIVGVSLNPEVGGKHLEINSIRNVFPKDNAEWLNWINQGKLLYVNKNKIQALINQQRTILADVDYLDLDSIANIVRNFENPKVGGNKLYRSTIDPPQNGVARKYYEEKTRKIENIDKKDIKARAENLMWRLGKSYVDSMKALQTFTDGVLKETGNKMHGFEDAYKAENRLSSMDKTQQEAWERDFFIPVQKAITGLMKKGGSSYLDLKTYIVAKHGLERNEVLAKRDFDKYQEEHPSGRKTLEDFREKDYSGLTALTGEGEVANAEEAARQIVDSYEKRHGKDMCDGLWKAINGATKSSLKKRYDSGLMSKEAYEHTRDMFKYYVPLKGWDSNVAADEYEYMNDSRGRIGSPKMIMAKGRSSLADDPIATIGADGCVAIHQGNRNVMKRHFLNFVLNNPTSLTSLAHQWYVLKPTGEWVEDEPAIPTNADGDRIAQIVAEHEREMEKLRQEGKAQYRREHLKLGLNTTKAEQNEHKIKVLVGGRERVIYINGNPMVAQAVNGVSNPDVHTAAFEKIWKWLQSLYSNVLTSKNPAFVLANLSMDAIQASAYTAIREDRRYNAQAFSNAQTVYRKALMPRLIYKWQHGTLDTSKETERYFDEFMRNGGETGITQLNTVDKVKKDIERFIKEADSGVSSIPQKAWRGVWEGVEFLNRSAEDTNRFICYMTSRQMGRDVAQSIWDAKDITVNFNKKGDGGMGARYLKGAFVFFNAAIQSLRNLGKTVASNPIKASAVISSFAGAGFIVPMLNMSMISLFSGGGDGDDDDPMQWYWDLPEWQRRNNVILYIPYTKNFFMIPLPHELRVFYGAGECAFSALNGKQTLGEALEDAVIGLNSMLPLDFTGNGGNAVLNLTPSLGQPIVQVIANEDYFGRPIYRRSDYGKYEPEWTKAYKGTGALAISLSKFINSIGNAVPSIHKQPWDGWWSNPDVMEHLIGSYFGGLGKTVMQTYKTVSMPWDKDVRQWRNVPVVSRFVTGVDERNAGSDVNERYYKALDEYNQTQSEFGQYKKAVNMDSMEYAGKLDDFMKSEEFKRYMAMYGYQKAIEYLRKQLEYKEANGLNTENVEDSIKWAKTKMVEELQKLEDKK